MSLVVLHGYVKEKRVTYFTSWSEYQKNRRLLDPIEDKFGTLWLRDEEVYDKTKYPNDVIVDDIKKFIKQIT